MYAEIVQSPAYRDEKRGTVLRMLPELLSGRRGARLAAHIDGTPGPGPQAVLISNNPYGTNDLAGLGRRARLDRGPLGVVTISVRSTRQAVGLLYRAHDHGLARHTATEVVIDADTPTVPVGVDGESLVAARRPCGARSNPVRCASGSRATGPAYVPAKPALDALPPLPPRVAGPARGGVRAHLPDPAALTRYHHPVVAPIFRSSSGARLRT